MTFLTALALSNVALAAYVWALRVEPTPQVKELRRQFEDRQLR